MPNESTETPAAPFEPRLRRGDRIGAHTVSRFLEVGPLGERYSALYGSTNHLVCLTVPSPGEEDPGFGPYAELCAPLARCPCVMHQFAGGVDGDTPWLRSELSSGTPEWTLASPLDPDALPEPEDEDETEESQYLTVRTLGDLLRATGEELSDRDRDQLLGDVLEGLRDLHANGFASGHLTPDRIDLDRFAHSRHAVARIRFYGPIDPATGYDPASDIRLAGALFRTFASPGGRSRTRADNAFAQFADRLESGQFPTAAEALRGYLDMLRARGVSRTERREPDAPTPKPKAPAASATGGASGSGPGAHGRRRHHRHHAKRQQMSRLAAFAAGSEAAGRAVLFLRIAIVLSFILALGFGVYFLLEWMDEKERYGNRIESLSSFSAVERIALVDPDAQSGPEGEGADAESDEFFAARRELADVAAPGAGERMAAEIPSLRDKADSDPEAAALLGEALLLGFGADRDLAEALRLLESARAAGIPRAAMRLGDLFSSPLPAPKGTPSDRAERDSLAFAAYAEAAGSDRASRELAQEAADRIVALLRRQKTATGFAKASEWVHAAAGRGHVASMMLLGIPGPFTEPRESLKWLRRLTDSQLPDEILGWAQTRRAECYAEGRGGTQKSDASARRWFENGAEHGNPTAMLSLAEFCEKGRGAKDSAPDLKRAAELRRKAEEAGSEPNPFPTLPSL